MGSILYIYNVFCNIYVLEMIMLDKINFFLKICFGCHCRADRSFFYKNKQFPICARCTGELIGIIISIPMIILNGVFSIKLTLLMTIPIIIDGFLQLKTKYESNNIKRLITGILFGLIFFSLIYNINDLTIKSALNKAQYVRENYINK